MEDFVFCHDNICLILHKALNYSYDALQTPPPPPLASLMGD